MFLLHFTDHNVLVANVNIAQQLFACVENSVLMLLYRMTHCLYCRLLSINSYSQHTYTYTLGLLLVATYVVL